MTSPMRVLVAGGGLGGLALAQGLVGAGFDVQVVERDADMNRRQGYYLNINALGGEALRSLLPADLFELYLDTSRRPYPTQASVVLDPQLTQLGARPSMGPPNTGERRHTGVHRRTLRQILLSGLEDVVRFGVSATSYEEDADGVVLHLSDGTSLHGDVLVCADGIRSSVRDQRLPGTRVVSTAIKGIDLYGRVPFTPELLAVVPEQLHDGVLIVTDGRSRCLMASFRPRMAIADAVAQDAPDAVLDDVPEYMMISCSVDPGTVVPPSAEWDDSTPATIRDGMLRAVHGWHPAVGALIARIDLDSIFSIAFSYLEPMEEWEPSRVTVLGDAAHGMLPTLGMGANMALNDARILRDRLLEARDGGAGLAPSLGAYEAEMRAEAYPVLRLTVDHDKVFGGGALDRAEQ
jgi:2-polyprenyl-6-methoxyphenol hydroxylase-like FAD-dependent oxidoreductase